MKTFAIELLLHFGVSMLRLFVAAACTVLLALPLGWAAHRCQLVRRAVQLFCAFPVMALLPVLMLLSGIGEVCKQLVLVLSGLWISSMRLCGAFTRLQAYLLPFTVNRFGWNGTLLGVILRFLQYDIAESFRRTFLVSITLLLFAENYGTRYGVGYFINRAWQAFDYVGVAWGILLAAAMGVCCNFLIEKTVRKNSEPF